MGLEDEIAKQQAAMQAPPPAPDPNSESYKFVERCREFASLMTRKGIAPTDPLFSLTVEYSRQGMFAPKAKKLLRYVEDFWYLGFSVADEYDAGITSSGRPVFVRNMVSVISARTPDVEKHLKDGGTWKVDIDSATRAHLPRKGRPVYECLTSPTPGPDRGFFSEEGLAQAFIKLTHTGPGIPTGRAPFDL